MAIKTATSVKKSAAPVKKTAAAVKSRVIAKKAVPARKPVSTRKASKGDIFECGVCGLAVTVDEISGYAEETVILCCAQPMKARKKKAATRAKK